MALTTLLFNRNEELKRGCMAIYDLYSKRARKSRGESPDVYTYNEIPKSLRVQIIHIIRDAIGEETPYKNSEPDDTYKRIHDVLCREYGVFNLAEKSSTNFEAVYNYFLQSKELEECLDIIEISFRVIDFYVRERYIHFRGYSKQEPDDAINELNNRFKECSIGFEYVSGEIVKIDSQLIHSEVVKPVLLLLSENDLFEGSNQEFLSAHEHYRQKRYEECLVDCLKSLESFIKAVCKINNWDFNETDNASKLIKICFDKELIPTYLQTQFSSLRSLVESGIPTVRNKQGGHGQGAKVRVLPEHLISYALHLTASNILFLCKSNELLNN